MLAERAQTERQTEKERKRERERERDRERQRQAEERDRVGGESDGRVYRVGREGVARVLAERLQAPVQQVAHVVRQVRIQNLKGLRVWRVPLPSFFRSLACSVSVVPSPLGSGSRVQQVAHVVRQIHVQNLASGLASSASQRSAFKTC